MRGVRGVSPDYPLILVGGVAGWIQAKKVLACAASVAALFAATRWLIVPIRSHQ